MPTLLALHLDREDALLLHDVIEMHLARCREIVRDNTCTDDDEVHDTIRRCESMQRRVKAALFP